MAVLKKKDPATGQWVPVAELESVTEDYERFFDITADGVASLKKEYRGDPPSNTYPYAVSDNGIGVAGSKFRELPDVLVVPDVIDGTAVIGCQPGTFYNNKRIRQITLPIAMETIPQAFCQWAVLLRAIYNTEQVKSVEGMAFMNTRVEKLLFPKLETVSVAAFGGCGFLRVADIGKITSIPDQLFIQCASLSAVIGGKDVTTIGNMAFYYTRNLRNLPLLGNKNGQTYLMQSIGKNAFYQSRIQFDWSLLSGCTFSSGATPVMDNTDNYWTDVTHKYKKNALVSKLSQNNDAWKNIQYGSVTDADGTSRTYGNACAVFTCLHIHSALSGMKYDDPRVFTGEIGEIDSNFLTNGGWPGNFDKVAPLFRALGYKATVYTGRITEESYQAMVDALYSGAYVYSTASTANNIDGGHAVAIYGVTEDKELMVLDSNVIHEAYRPTGLDDSVCEYRMAYQNLAGPNSGFIVVEKYEE